MRRWVTAAYGRRTWARVLYVLIGVPLAVLDLGYVVVAIVVFGAFSVITVGLPLLATGVVGARGPGGLHRGLARGLLGLRVGRPPRFRAAPGLLGWIRSGLADGPGWRAVAYLAIRLPLSVVQFAVGSLWWYGLLFATLPAFWRTLPTSLSYDSHHRPHRAAVDLGDFYADTWHNVLLVAGAGVLLLLIAPWATRLALLPEGPLVRGLLGPSRTARLRETRALAVDDSATALRRIERDLHDGAQAQLVALAMKLGLAKEELRDGDTQAALTLVDTAHQGAKAALAELRDLARGIHPPALDTGLAPALETLASRSAVPVRLDIDLPERPSPAIETIAYFSAAELLANVAKHSRAERATLRVAATRPGFLEIVVRDEGIGGAQPRGGLAGLADRARMVDGTLSVDSPPGGPTVVRVELPVKA